MSSFNIFRKIIAPEKMEDMKKFTTRVNEALDTLYEKVFGYLEMSDMAKATQTIINSKTDSAKVISIIGDETDDRFASIEQNIESVTSRVTTLSQKYSEIKQTAESIVMTVQRNEESNSNVNQTANKWEVTVYEEIAPTNRNYVRYGKPETASQTEGVEDGSVGWDPTLSLGSTEVPDDFPCGVTTVDGQLCWYWDNSEGQYLKYGRIKIDTSEAVSDTQEMNRGFKVTLDQDKSDYIIRAEMYGDGASMALYRANITANTWTTVTERNFDGIDKAKGKDFWQKFQVPEGCIVYVTDLYVEKNDASATHAYSGWIHTSDDDTYKTFSIEHDKVAVADEDGELGNVPAGGAKSVTIATSDWNSSTKTCAVSISNLRTDMTVLVAPAAASLDLCGRHNIRCTAQAAGSLTFTCDTVPTADVVENIVVLGGLATW